MDPPAPFHPTATRRIRNVRVGVGVLVVHPYTGNIYAGIRINSHGNNTLALPGGHLELYESWEACAQREVWEEMQVTITNLQFVHVTNDPMPNDNQHYVTIFMMGTLQDSSQEPINAEPNKCKGWLAYEWNDLCQQPLDQLFTPLKHLVQDNPPALQQYIQNILQRTQEKQQRETE